MPLYCQSAIVTVGVISAFIFSVIVRPPLEFVGVRVVLSPAAVTDISAGSILAVISKASRPLVILLEVIFSPHLSVNLR